MMEAPQTEAAVPAEQKAEKKRSPWLVVIIILLLMMACCCAMGAILCRGGAMLPGFLDDYIRDIPGLENVDQIRDLMEDIINDPNFDPENFNPEDFFPEGELEEFYPDANICSGLSGYLELQIVVGPAEAADLEPLGIGTIPLNVGYSDGAYPVSGYGVIDYQAELEEVWGTYVVTFDSTATIDGTCRGDEYSGVLDLGVFTEGEQLIQVFVGSEEWDYPWSGEYEFDLTFPVEDGAVSSGEGWAFVLHLE